MTYEEVCACCSLNGRCVYQKHGEYCLKKGEVK